MTTKWTHRFCSRVCFVAAKTIPPADRFWPKVNKDGPVHSVFGTPCWLWTGTTHKGYGLFWIPGRSPAKAHRVAWELINGPIPDGLNACHRCDNPPCCNPDHLFLGTLADNNRDMLTKGRASGGGATGDRHGSRTHPEKLKRGEAHGMSYLTEEAVRTIRADYATGVTQATLAWRYRVEPTTIRRVLKRETWKHVK